MTALEAADAGLIDLDAPVPQNAGLPAVDPPVPTPRQLLRHTAGLVECPEVVGDSEPIPDDLELLQAVLDAPRQNEPVRRREEPTPPQPTSPDGVKLSSPTTGCSPRGGSPKPSASMTIRWDRASGPPARAGRRPDGTRHAASFGHHVGNGGLYVWPGEIALVVGFDDGDPVAIEHSLQPGDVFRSVLR